MSCGNRGLGFAALITLCAHLIGVAHGAEKSSVPLQVQVSEEGQRVAFDRYTWQRRELAKRLPLTEAWPTDAALSAAFAKYGLDQPPIPEAIPTPAMIVPDVYLVGSQPNHTYLIDAGADALVLVDPGLTSNFDAIVARVEQLGYSRKRIRWVLNTHAHFDHSMADGMFQKLGAQILIGTADADAVERGTRVTAGFMLPADIGATYPRTRIDWRVADGEELHLGNKIFHAIHTPGHTEGSTCFLLQIEGRNLLFSGDTLLYDHRLGAQVTAYADNQAYVGSLRKLARFTLNITDRVRWDVLLPGHGTLVLERAYLDVDKGWRTVQIDLLEGDPVDALPFATERYRTTMFGRP